MPPFEFHHHYHFGPDPEVLRRLDAIDQKQDLILDLLRRPRGISLGAPVTTDLEGNVIMTAFATNLLVYFPIKVNGVAPPAVDTFSAAPSDPSMPFTTSIGVTPGTGPDAGLPAVVAAATTLAGAPSLSFVTNDGQGDLPVTDTFDFVAPVAPPPPPGQISIDDAGVQTQANPSPPIV
jgi:hypothetical protein